jgi:acetate kinase
MANQAEAHRILTINSGSSSLKVGLYTLDKTEILVFSATLERIGHPNSRMQVKDAHDALVVDQLVLFPDHTTALKVWLKWLQDNNPGLTLAAVGHRVVHGGSHYTEPQIITPQLITNLKDLVPLAPDHLPQAIEAIQLMNQLYPEILQIACFDTAFHRQMPRVAQLYALPRDFIKAGVVRYGFHGLSYEYILYELGRLDHKAAQGRLIIAHLGNGASMAAVRGGFSLDTTMGFTPTGGLVMSTRSGDLDPGVLLYLLQEKHLPSGEMNELINQKSGLLGVSGSSGNMQELLEKETIDLPAAEAVELFCYQARKFIGALTAVLGGLDTLVFTGGIGEHAALIRQRICTGLEFLGIELAQDKNEAHTPVISSPDNSRVVVRVIPTDEDLMIARHTRVLLAY